MTAGDFNGLMIFRGGCLADGLKFGVIDVMPAVRDMGEIWGRYGRYDRRDARGAHAHARRVRRARDTSATCLRTMVPQVHMYGMYVMVADLLSSRN